MIFANMEPDYSSLPAIQMPRLAFGRPAAPIVVALSIACLACTGSQKSTQEARPDRSVITREQIHEHRFTNAYDAVQALHSNWLQVKGTDALQSPVRVYVDHASLGGVETLRNVDVASIQSIRYFDGVAATARWGIDHGGGVILVMTHQ
jgi:hypothetical protein